MGNRGKTRNWKSFKKIGYAKNRKSRDNGKYNVERVEKSRGNIVKNQ